MDNNISEATRQEQESLEGLFEILTDRPCGCHPVYADMIIDGVRDAVRAATLQEVREALVKQDSLMVLDLSDALDVLTQLEK